MGLWRQSGRTLLSRSPSGLAAISCLCISSLSSYLCFESSKSGSSKRNKVIKLVDITDIQKVGAHPSHHSPSPGWRGLRMIPGLGETLSRDVFGCRCHQCCTLSSGSLRAEPCQLPSERVVYLGPRQSRFSRSLGKSAAGLDTVTHTEKGNSEVCLTNCAPWKKDLMLPRLTLNQFILCCW